MTPSLGPSSNFQHAPPYLVPGLIIQIVTVYMEMQENERRSRANSNKEESSITDTSNYYLPYSDAEWDRIKKKWYHMNNPPPIPHGPQVEPPHVYNPWIYALFVKLDLKLDWILFDDITGCIYFDMNIGLVERSVRYMYNNDMNQHSKHVRSFEPYCKNSKLNGKSKVGRKKKKFSKRVDERNNWTKNYQEHIGNLGLPPPSNSGLLSNVPAHNASPVYHTGERISTAKPDTAPSSTYLSSFNKSRARDDLAKSSPFDMEASATAAHFVPQNKRRQWYEIPHYGLYLVAPSLSTASEQKGRWRRDVSSPFDLCIFNLLHLAYPNDDSKVYDCKFFNAVKTVANINSQSDLVILNLKSINTYREAMESVYDLSSDRQSSAESHSFPSELMDIVKSDAEVVAKTCDSLYTIMANPNLVRHVIKHYMMHLFILLDIERVRCMEDIKRHDLYSQRTLNKVVIAPPAKKIEACRRCNLGCMNSSYHCAYHLGVYCNTEHIISKVETPVLVKRENAAEILDRLSIEDDDRVVVTVTVDGVSENRPLVTIGDYVRFRFDENDGGQTELIGEVLSISIKTEEVTISLPAPIRLSSFYFVLLENICGDRRVRRFDMRFGLGWCKTFDMAKRVLNDLMLDDPAHLERCIAPNHKTGGILSKEERIGEESLLMNLVNPLNKEQRQVVTDITNKSHGAAPYIVNGPPGTGKTMAVVETITQLLRRSDGHKILLCAPSDAACDVLAKRLYPVSKETNTHHPFTILRVNWWSRNPSSLPLELLPCSICNQDGYFFIPKSDVLMKADVIICQCFVAGYLEDTGENWMKSHFTHVFIDEVCQALEPEALVPLSKVGLECSIILAGDPKQLNPIVHDPVAAVSGLSLSYQERLLGLPLYKRLNDNPLAVMTHLKANYRSHAALLQVPSALFYDNELVYSADDSMSKSCEAWELLSNHKFPMLVFDIKGKEVTKPDISSYYNIDECESVVKIVTALTKSTNVSVRTNDIAVITPFRAQVLKLRSYLRKAKFGGVNVGTVEDFQGQEKRIVFISTVLTKHHLIQSSGMDSTKCKFGFMNDPKRFNVALTRASALNVIIGHVKYLEDSNTYWSALMEHVRRNNGMVDSNNHDSEYNYYDEDYGVSLLLEKVQEMKLLGSGAEEDRYEMAVQGYYQETPSWRVILS